MNKHVIYLSNQTIYTMIKFIHNTCMVLIQYLATYINNEVIL